MKKEFTLKRYKTIQGLTTSWAEDEIGAKIESFNGETVGGISPDGEEIEISFKEFVRNIKKQGCWGFVDEDFVIHYWVKEDLDMGELIHFLAHEIGHRTGKPNKNDIKEELRAEEFGEVSALAYNFAKQIKENA